MFEVGDRIRNYEIVARLKPGGMGTLLRARRVGAAGFSRDVAIKVIHPHLSTETSFVRAFVNEALLASKVSHPNVARVEELGEEQGIYFLVMEYVEGCTLAELLTELGRRRSTLAPEATVAIALRALDGLHAAHETTDDEGRPLGLVHRDVSPQNILLSVAGEIKLIDFGVAKARDYDSTTAAGEVKGKLRYMSPEQAYGREIDRRSDVYASGIVLWEMMTQRRMFASGNRLALIDQVRNPKISPPHLLAPIVSPELSRVVMSALSPNAEDRPATAREPRRMLLEVVPAALAVEADQLAELVTITHRESPVPPRARGLTITGGPGPEANAEGYAFEEAAQAVHADTSAHFAAGASAGAPRRSGRVLAWAAAGLAAMVLAGFVAQWFALRAEPLPAPVKLEAKIEPPAPEVVAPAPVEAAAPAAPAAPDAPEEPPKPAKKKKKSKTKKSGVPFMEEVPF